MVKEPSAEFYVSQEWDYWGTLKLVLQELQGIRRS